MCTIGILGARCHRRCHQPPCSACGPPAVLAGVTAVRTTLCGRKRCCSVERVMGLAPRVPACRWPRRRRRHTACRTRPSQPPPRHPCFNQRDAAMLPHERRNGCYFRSSMCPSPCPFCMPFVAVVPHTCTRARPRRHLPVKMTTASATGYADGRSRRQDFGAIRWHAPSASVSSTFLSTPYAVAAAFWNWWTEWLTKLHRG